MQLRKENGWTEDEMAKHQNKAANQRKTTKFKGRYHHCGKYGHKKAHCRDWLKLTKEE